MFWGWFGEYVDKREREKLEEEARIQKFKQDHPIRYKINYYTNNFMSKLSWIVILGILLFIFVFAPLYTLYNLIN
ncbi:hypothetical protein VPHK406_0227 [Vibrio phage K406]